jgi:glycosyltransferase involved in cell wall biosynthesis
MEGYRSEKTFIAEGPVPRPEMFGKALLAQLSSRHYDLVHVHGEVAAALCLPSLALGPSVVTINGLHLVRRLKGWRRTLAEANLRIVVRAASKTIAVGETEFTDAKSVVGGTEKLVLVRNGVELSPQPTPEERGDARTYFNVAERDTVGVYVAALDPHKEPLTVARAALDVARRGVPLVLLFAGDGPLRPELEELAGEGAVLRLVGYQPEVRRVFAAADIFVLPSRREGLSFALLEAMSIGLPPVVSDAPGNSDAIGEAGLLVPAGDMEGFSRALEQLATDKSMRASLGEQARRRVESRFSLEQMLTGTRQVYEEAI